MPGSATSVGRPGTRMACPSVLPSRSSTLSAPTLIILSRLNGWPMHSPADASPVPSRTPAHGSGPMRFATPSSQWTCTTYSLPVARRTEDRYLKLRRDTPDSRHGRWRGNRRRLRVPRCPFMYGSDGSREIVAPTMEVAPQSIRSCQISFTASNTPQPMSRSDPRTASRRSSILSRSAVGNPVACVRPCSNMRMRAE